MTNTIVLCGFMGSGKSNIGRRTAAKLGYEFIDMDGYIQKKYNKTISDIFRDSGENVFRRMETDAVRELAGRQKCVIAAGGGTVLRRENVELFRQNGCRIVLLDVPLAALQERLKNDTRRPLLQVEDRRSVIADLYQKRLPLYREAADVVFYAGWPANYGAKLLAREVQEGRI